MKKSQAEMEQFEHFFAIHWAKMIRDQEPIFILDIVMICENSYDRCF